jgi:sarcosine oxidase, subunit beta
VRDLVLEGSCTFADIDKFKLSRFAGFPPDWAVQRGWVPPVPAC